MPPYERHVFVCVNERDARDPRGCCSAKAAAEVCARLKQLAHGARLRGRVRINKAGCLDQCARGVALVVYPEAVWYGRVTVADVDELFEEHVLNGRPVERLRLDSMRPAPEPEAG
jgi:(2Fe-2S) ferredoxin